MVNMLALYARGPAIDPRLRHRLNLKKKSTQNPIKSGTVCLKLHIRKSNKRFCTKQKKSLFMFLYSYLILALPLQDHNLPLMELNESLTL